MNEKICNVMFNELLAALNKIQQILLIFENYFDLIFKSIDNLISFKKKILTVDNKSALFMKILQNVFQNAMLFY